MCVHIPMLLEPCVLMCVNACTYIRTTINSVSMTSIVPNKLPLHRNSILRVTLAHTCQDHVKFLSEACGTYARTYTFICVYVYEYILPLQGCHSFHVHTVSCQTVLTFPVDVDVEKLIGMQFFHNDPDDSDLANSSLRRKLFGKPNQKNCTMDTETHTEVCLSVWLTG